MIGFEWVCRKITTRDKTKSYGLGVEVSDYLRGESGTGRESFRYGEGRKGAKDKKKGRWPRTEKRGRGEGEREAAEKKKWTVRGEGRRKRQGSSESFPLLATQEKIRMRHVPGYGLRGQGLLKNKKTTLMVDDVE